MCSRTHHLSLDPNKSPFLIVDHSTNLGPQGLAFTQSQPPIALQVKIGYSFPGHSYTSKCHQVSLRKPVSNGSSRNGLENSQHQIQDGGS